MQQVSHTSTQFDAQLAQAHAKVMRMGELVQRQVRLAMQGLRSGDGTLIDQVLAAEGTVNSLELEIDELCTTVIARRTPTAVDLRLLIAMVKTITDLERIGDEAKKIALTGRELAAAGRAQMLHFPDIAHVEAIVNDMLQRALDAFDRLELEDTAEIARRDLDVDESFRSVLREMLTYMIEDPRTISRSLDIVFVAKSLERIGDHAKNIAEYVVYMVKGKDVRHVTIEEIEQAIKS